MWLLGVVVRRYMYIDFLILFIPTPLVSALFLQQHPYFLFIFNMFFVLVPALSVIIYVIIFYRSINTHTGDYGRPTAAI